MLPLLLACTDYAFEKSLPEPAVGDSGAPDADTADTAPPTDTATPDRCYEPEDGYAQNPAAKLVSTAGGSPFTVTFVSASTAYRNDLRLDGPESLLLAQAYADAPGSNVQVGPYAPESELVFGIFVHDTGDHFHSGPGSRNADGVVHVAVTYEGACSWLIGFEDLYGGGDLDYNDVVLRVQGFLRQD